MEHPFVINFPKEQRQESASSEITEMRTLLSELDHRYMMYEPSSYYYTAKRAMDITISLFFMALIMSWLLPIVALLIKITSKGPVFFKQKRTGYKGIEFDCFKFRTMYVNADADIKQAVADDKRITPIGRFLRITHIDEVPQFLNVLIGDMSIVGPRPHMLYHTSYYAEHIPYYNLRHETPPGMTGMAQVKGYIGEINMTRELRKRVQWDIYYLKHRSVWMDIKIIMTTFAHVALKMVGLQPKRNA
ncbi:MAG: sugar transferase [Taibaiella sp.]|nr:sugar transferase [Taibaiella sp.]